MLTIFLIFSIYKLMENINRIDNVISDTKKELAIYTISGKCIHHFIWENKISNALQNENITSLHIETNPQKCKLGKWFLSKECMEAKKIPELKLVLDSLEILHTQLHESAIELNNHLSSNNKSLAISIYNTETKEYLNKFKLLIKTINKKIEHEYQPSNLTKQKGIIIISLIVFVVILAWLITNKLAKKLRVLTNQSQLISYKNIDSHQLKNKDDFDQILQSLHEILEEFKAINQTLEPQVICNHVITKQQKSVKELEVTVTMKNFQFINIFNNKNDIDTMENFQFSKN